jgi:hypothetical protein
LCKNTKTIVRLRLGDCWGIFHLDFVSVNNIDISFLGRIYTNNEIDQIDPRGPRKGHASHRTTHSAWVRGWIYTVIDPLVSPTSQSRKRGSIAKVTYLPQALIPTLVKTECFLKSEFGFYMFPED